MCVRASVLQCKLTPQQLGHARLHSTTTLEGVYGQPSAMLCCVVLCFVVLFCMGFRLGTPRQTVWMPGSCPNPLSLPAQSWLPWCKHSPMLHSVQEHLANNTASPPTTPAQLCWTMLCLLGHAVHHVGRQGTFKAAARQSRPQQVLHKRPSVLRSMLHALQKIDAPDTPTMLSSLGDTELPVRAAPGARGVAGLLHHPAGSTTQNSAHISDMAASMANTPRQPSKLHKCVLTRNASHLMLVLCFVCSEARARQAHPTH